MDKKEISLVKKMLGKDALTQLNCCYIDQQGSVIAKTKQNLLTLEEEEQKKYLTIFKKCLTGKEGKNLLSLSFPQAAETDGQMQPTLYTWTRDFQDPDAIFEKIIQNYTWCGDHFVILLGSGVYDLPTKGADGEILEDGDDVYAFTICCICPVELSGEGLIYSEEDISFTAMEKKWTIQQPINGFLFPAFQDGGSDIHSVLYFAKKELHAEFITNGLACDLPLEESDQKEYFSSALSMAFPDDYTLERAADVYKEVQKCIEEEQDLGKKELRNIMESCGAEEERLKEFDENYPEHLTLHPKNIIDEKNYVINGNGITLKVTADHMDLLEYKEIDGQSYLCIPVSAGLEKDDLKIKEKKEV